MSYRIAAALLTLLALAVPAARAEQIDNPEYTQWAKYKPGTYVTLTQSSEMPGMAAPAGMPAGMDMSAMMPKTSITTRLTEVKPDALTLEISTNTTQMGRSTENKTTRTVSARIEKPTTMPATSPAATQVSGEVKDIKEGKETLEINGKKVDTVTREYDTTINAAGREAKSHVKTWTSDAVPGGTVKTESTTDIQQMGQVKSLITVTDFNVVK